MILALEPFLAKVAGMEEQTIFHRILAKEIPADILYEDEEVIAFKDIRPKAPTHVLFIPKTFVASIAEITPETAPIPGMLILKAKAFAEKNGINGYKLVFHVGKAGEQEVFYLHLHLLSQQQLREQPAA
jgi:histidine triad (HIT) family protein